MSVEADSPLRGRMIFAVGSRRSGTYWLQRIICAHPTVAEVPAETHLFSHGIAPLVERFQDHDRGLADVGRIYLERDRLRRHLRALCDDAFGGYLNPPAERVAERTPLHAFHLALLAEIYPDARFVHIIRDGRDVTRSICAQPWGPTTVAGAAREWRDAVASARAAGLDSERYREIRYERLAVDPEAEIEALYRWLGLPCSGEDLAHSLAESRREANVDGSTGEGPGVGKWRAGFSRDDLAAFDAIAGEMLGELGYERVDPGTRARAKRRAGDLLRGRVGPDR